MWKAIRCCLLLAAIAMLLTGTAIAAPEEQASGGPIIGPLWGVYQQAPPQAIVAQYERFEITFDMTGTAPAASNLQFPFDPVGFDPNGNPEAGGVDPAGLPQAIGITVDGVFRYNGPEPAFEVIQPAFLYQPTLIEPSFGGDAKKDWIYPLGEPYWMVRFTPKQVGDWEYRIRVRDAATWNACDPGNPDSCWTYSEWRALTVVPAQSGQHGFVEVVAPGQADRRYFEFSDGSPYAGLGHRFEYAHFPGINEIKSEFERYSTYGVDFVRAWMDMALIYSEGTHGWDGWKWRDKQTSTAEVYGPHDFSVKRGYDDAIYQGSDDAQAIAGGLEAGKSYELRVRAKLTAIDTGVTPQSSDLVVKIVSNPNAWLDTGYTLCNGSLEELRMEDDGWGEYGCRFDQASRIMFAGNTQLLVGSVREGVVAYIDEIYIGEVLSDDRIGPNVVFKGQMNYHLYFDQLASAKWDQIIDTADAHNVYLKLVISDKEDKILARITAGGVYSDTLDPSDNHDNFYSGEGEKSRRLQEYYWRYLAARWGYATAIHSWELLNEGEHNEPHYIHAAHFCATMHRLDSNHLCTTSFDLNFNAAAFWNRPEYSSLDYADVHAYISTGWLDSGLAYDAAGYHIQYSQDTREELVASKPIVRGEAGIDRPERQCELYTENRDVPGLDQDRRGVWLHNYTWSMLHAGGLYELYWWYDPEEPGNGEPCLIPGNIQTQPGPDGNRENGLYEIYRVYQAFVDDIPLANGLYAAVEAEHPYLRVVGQHDRVHGRAHLWLQNLCHTWARVVQNDGCLTQWPHLDGNVTIRGFVPGHPYRVELWDTWATDMAHVIRRAHIMHADAQGTIVLDLSNRAFWGLTRLDDFDVAFKIGPADIVVNSAADPGEDGICDAVECTLREAITLSNQIPEHKLMWFKLPGAGPHLIEPRTPLPGLYAPVTIDGYWLSGADPASTPLITGWTTGLSGNDTLEHGLAIGVPGVTIRGLEIYSFTIAGVTIHNMAQPAYVVLEGNQLRNNRYGVNIFGAANTIGGVSVTATNVISGNVHCGIGIISYGAYSNTVVSNQIIDNEQCGVEITRARDNRIGGCEDGAPGQQNLFAGNGQDIIVFDAYSVGNRLDCNVMPGPSRGLGIELTLVESGDGVTPNDYLDLDRGPNELQNYPELVAAIRGSPLHVDGTLHSAPDATFTVSLYGNTECNPSGHGGGGNVLGVFEVHTDAQGNGSISVDVTAPAGARFVTAMATDANGNSSEFSSCIPITEERFARLTLCKNAEPDSPRNFRFWGAYGKFRLDDPGADDGDAIDRCITYDQVIPGTHCFSDDLPYRWYLLDITCSPVSRCQADLAQQTVCISARAGDDIAVKFTNVHRGSLYVRSYWDRNGNGRRDQGDRGQGGWWTTLYDDSGRLIASNFTNDNGKWNIHKLMPAADYVVCQDPRPGWTNTEPGWLDPAYGGRACYAFTLQPGDRAWAFFGYVEDAAVGAAQLSHGPSSVFIDRFVDMENDAMYTQEEFVDHNAMTVDSYTDLYLPLVQG